ncbi:MAG: gamma-glutamyltransferase, partial [Gammaproteobacteria bacterium]|nr:gamma-glutamyltransferase [Gammaproteobacteria bacterium]
MSNQFDKSNPEPPSGIKKSQQSLSKDFMIVTADKRASLAAKEILLNGGNALDAAIAAQNVLSVVEPQSSGLGGGGFLLFYNNSNKKIYALDGRETSSSSVKNDMFLINDKK